MRRSTDRRAASGSLANPGLVMQFSIGQTTMATRQAIANLYYRSVRFLRPVEIGETLTTLTRVLGLADSAPKAGQHRGKVWLGVTTSIHDEPVVTYERCALVRGRGPTAPGHSSDIPPPSGSTPLADLVDSVAWVEAVVAAVDGLAGGRGTHRSTPRPHRSRRTARPPDVQPGRGAPGSDRHRFRRTARLRRPRPGPGSSVADASAARDWRRSPRGMDATTSAPPSKVTCSSSGIRSWSTRRQEVAD